MLWQWIEHLRERWADLAPPPAPTSASGAHVGDVDAALAAELQAAELLEGGEGALEGEAGGVGQRPQRAQRAELDEELERAMAEVAETVVHGEPVTERRSTFQVR